MEFTCDLPLCHSFLQNSFLSPLSPFVRFVGDQEAWHELAELYINEHE